MGQFIKEEFIDKTPEELAEEARLKKEQEEKVINTLERRKERRIIILFAIILCCVPFIIPKLTSIFKQDSMDNYNATMREIRKIKTIDGYMLIGNTEATSSIGKFNFFNVRKSNSNKISFAYEATGKIDNEYINSLNIYIEITNKDKEVIYREKFVPTSEMLKGKTKRYSKSLDSFTYANAYYLKIKEIKELSQNTEILTCTHSLKKDSFTLEYEIDYTFNDNFLTKYEVIKNINGSINDNNANLVNLKKEYNEASSEINATFNNNSLHYSVDLTKEYNSFKPIISYGATKYQITNSTISNNWSCK